MDGDRKKKAAHFQSPPTLKRNVVVAWIRLVVKRAVEGTWWRIIGGRSLSITTSAGRFDFPGVEVHVVAPLVFVSANIESYFEFIADTVSIELVDFIADAFKFHHLGVFAVGDFDHEFTFGEAAREGLQIFENLEGAG